MKNKLLGNWPNLRYRCAEMIPFRHTLSTQARSGGRSESCGCAKTPAEGLQQSRPAAKRHHLGTVVSKGREWYALTQRWTIPTEVPNLTATWRRLPSPFR